MTADKKNQGEGGAPKAWATERLPELIGRFQHLQARYHDVSEHMTVLRDQIQRIDAQLALLRDVVGSDAFREIWESSLSTQSQRMSNETISSQTERS